MIAVEQIKMSVVYPMIVLLFAVSLMRAGDVALPDPLPDPDGKPADMSKPVKVFILMGQSNMVGMGNVSGDKEGTLEYAVRKKGKYPYLVDDAGKYTVRNDVRNVRVMDLQDFVNDWLTPEGLNTIGPELGIGHYVGQVMDEPVMLLKSCIGNRSLGFDLLPPGTEPYEFGGKTYPGYRGTADKPKGTGEKPDGWYAGKQYDSDVESAKQVLANLDKYYPGANAYEVVGFFWWQGDKDMRDAGHAAYYEKNLQLLTDVLRKEFEAPEAKFVCASLGQTKEGSSGGDAQILEAMKSVAKGQPGKAGFVYTHPLSLGGSSSSHYDGNAETYMSVGEVMGKAMVELLNSKAVASTGAMRTWTSLNGRTLDAKLVFAKDDKVLLETADGSRLEFYKAVLSESDQNYLKGL